LPAAVIGFNGFYTKSGKFVLMNSMHILIVLSVFVGAILIALVMMVVLYMWRRRRARNLRATEPVLTTKLESHG
jgi:hypothetical protein